MTLQGMRNRMTSDMIKMLLSAFIVLCSLTVVTKSFAEDSPNKGDVLYDFLKMAFTDKMWNESRSLNEYKMTLEKFPILESAIPEDVKKSSDWLFGNLARDRGVPDNNVIHKWADEITIGFGRPYYGGISDKYSEIIMPMVEEIIPDLKKSTDLPVKIILPEKEDYRTGYFGRIRIIPVLGVEYAATSNNFIGPAISGENLLWEAELFENNNRAEMMGFLLPKINNELGVSVCKIKMAIGIDRQQLKKAIDECLLRSVGLPGAMGGDPVHDGNVDQSEQTENSPFSRDRALRVISLLYCPDIKSGMSKNKALYALYNSNQCKF